MQNSIWAADDGGGSTPAASPSTTSRCPAVSVVPSGPPGGPGAQAMRAWIDTNNGNGNTRAELSEHRAPRARVVHVPLRGGQPILHRPNDVAGLDDARSTLPRSLLNTTGKVPPGSTYGRATGPRSTFSAAPFQNASLRPSGINGSSLAQSSTTASPRASRLLNSPSKGNATRSGSVSSTSSGSTPTGQGDTVVRSGALSESGFQGASDAAQYSFTPSGSSNIASPPPAPYSSGGLPPHLARAMQDFHPATTPAQDKSRGDSAIPSNASAHGPHQQTTVLRKWDTVVKTEDDDGEVKQDHCAKPAPPTPQSAKKSATGLELEDVHGQATSSEGATQVVSSKNDEPVVQRNDSAVGKDVNTLTAAESQQVDLSLGPIADGTMFIIDAEDYNLQQELMKLNSERQQAERQRDQAQAELHNIGVRIGDHLQRRLMYEHKKGKTLTVSLQELDMDEEL